MWNLPTVMHNMLLIHTLTNAPSVDLVNWTFGDRAEVLHRRLPHGQPNRGWPRLAIAGVFSLDFYHKQID